MKCKLCKRDEEKKSFMREDEKWMKGSVEADEISLDFYKNIVSKGKVRKLGNTSICKSTVRV